jgi:hypothetical protein
VLQLGYVLPVFGSKLRAAGFSKANLHERGKLSDVYGFSQNFVPIWDRGIIELYVTARYPGNVEQPLRLINARI